MAVKITSLDAENVKRIHAVQLTPADSGLTIIGGDNGQGKTSVLDAIAYALGGERYRPSDVTNNQSVIPAAIRGTLSNGLIVERKGKNSALKVTDPSGAKAGQKLLDSFISQFALDLPKFLEADSKEKARVLLQVIGVGDELARLDQQEKQLYSERLYVGRTADQKRKFAAEMPSYEGVPDIPVSASELIGRQQDILQRNSERQRWIQDAANIKREIEDTRSKIDALTLKLRDLEEKAEAVQHSPEELQMESTAELEHDIEQIDEINRKVRANLDKSKATDAAEAAQENYDDLTAKIETVRDQRTDLLNGADLPLKGLTVSDGELLYKGQKWDCMSGSEQLKVSTAIVRKLQPECGFVLMDKLEQFDTKTLREFGEWAEHEGLQIIATRVSCGDECSIIIEDGYSVPVKENTPAEKPLKKWQKGVF